MSGGRKAWTPTEKDLQLIKELSASNAPQKKIYTALGINYSTWKKYRDGDVENQAINQINQTPIKKALETGIEARLEKIKNNCIDSLDLMTRQHVVKEVKRVRRKGQETGEDGTLGTIIDTVVTRKVVDPNPTVVMFTSVNLMPERFQSINKVEVKQENNTTVPDEMTINWTKGKDGDNAKS